MNFFGKRSTIRRLTENLGDKKGFALIVALSLMAFIVVLLISTFSIFRIEAQSENTFNHKLVAKQNALFGLNTALGELQHYLGPDQRITATADIRSDADDTTRSWIGVWESSEANLVRVSGGNQSKPGTGSFLRWLVSLADGSGNPDRPGMADPTTIEENPFSGDAFGPVFMVNDDAGQGVQAGRITLRNSSGQADGTFAWWAGDESVKARINLRDPYSEATVDSEDWWNRWRAPPQFGTSFVAEGENYTVPQSDDVEKLVWVDSLGLLDPSLDNLRQHRFHDITTHSRGLIVDVRRGRLRRDLTAAFENPAVFDAAFPAGSKLFEFRDDPDFDTFLDSAPYSYNGPNWGILRGHYQMYEPNSWTGAGLGFNKKYPVLWRSEADPAQRPYMIQSGDVLTGDGVYQQNSPIYPVLARTQISIRISFFDLEQHGVEPEPLANGNTRFFKKPMIHVTPTLVLYNPYNVYLNVLQQRVEFSNNPLIEIAIGSREPVSFYLNEILAPNFTGTEGFIWGFRMRTQTSDIVLQPGESLIFGLDEAGYMYPNPQTHVYGSGWYLRQPGRLQLKNDNEIQHSFQLPTNADYILEARDDGADPTVFFQASSGPRPVYPPSGFSPDFPAFGLSSSERERLRIAEVFDEDGNLVPEDSEVDVSVRITFSNFANNWSITRDEAGTRVSTQRFQNDMGLTREGFEPEGNTVFELFETYSQLEARPSIATWRYGLRTINEDQENAIRFIDANFRAINLLPQVSGGWEDQTLPASLPMSNFGLDYGRLDSNTLSEMPGEWDDSEQRYRAFWGADIEGIASGVGNRTNVVFFDIPREPLLSIGALKHANVGRYGFHPNYIIGQSYVPPLVQRGNAWQSLNYRRENGNLLSGIFLDLPYILNSYLWDGYFFSSIPQDLSDSGLADLLSGQSALAISRHRLFFSPGLSETDIRYDGNDVDKAFRGAAGSLFIEGAFNVNSTSVSAWKALLSSSNGLPLPVYDPRNRSEIHSILEEEEGPLFPRVSRAYGGTDNLFSGARRLTLTEVEDLAEAIVEQVRARGPFGSLADFVNRSLGNPREMSHQESGALQAAIDNTSINQNAVDFSGAEPLGSYGSLFDQTPSGPQATGLAGYLLQSDILQLLGPVLTVRGDTFIVRSYGEKRDPISGEVLATARCEVVIQRLPLPFESGEDWSDERRLEELIEPTGDFGRNFQVVAFRWLNENDI